MLEMIKRFLQDEQGQDLVEYALLLVFLAPGCYRCASNPGAGR